MTFQPFQPDAFKDVAEAGGFSDAHPTPRPHPPGSSPRRPHRVGSTVYRRYVKQMLDTALVLAAAPFVLLLVVPLCLIIACDGANPFYSQLRVGKGGRHFRMWKLRSMIPDAEAQLARHLQTDETARQEWLLHQKLTVDPRITRIGHLIRATSLDELPQLYNVLAGDMSLVGPRPIMTDQSPLYHGTLYHSVKPGLTGTWQVSQRSTSTFAERVGYDDAYVSTFGFWQDVTLIAKTLRVVYRRTGQ